MKLEVRLHGRLQLSSAEKTAALRHRTKANAISLFDEIPVGRTCQSAGVAVHWCMCTYMESVPAAALDADAGDWQLTAEWLVGRINQLLRPAISAQLCQPLALTHVISAHYVIPTDLVRLATYLSNVVPYKL